MGPPQGWHCHREQRLGDSVGTRGQRGGDTVLAPIKKLLVLNGACPWGDREGTQEGTQGDREGTWPLSLR